MRRVRRVIPRRVVCSNRRVIPVCGIMLLTALSIGFTAHQAFGQAPGWSRGQQLLAITYDECIRRAPAGLQGQRAGAPGPGFVHRERSKRCLVVELGRVLGEFPGDARWTLDNGLDSRHRDGKQ